MSSRATAVTRGARHILAHAAPSGGSAVNLPSLP
jgi:hypothetical protein